MSSAQALSHGSGAGLLADMKKSRDRSAVLKSELVLLRSSMKNPLVFVFEGAEDKIVYHHWICKINHRLGYEPFVCTGKGKVLKLYSSVKKDLNGLSKGVYFFADRDYDTAQEHPCNEDFFLTDAYAVENYIVRTETVTELLRTHFHFAHDVSLREKLVRLFEAQYEEFLKITEEINFRGFVCRRLKIDAVPGLPKKLSKLAKVELQSVLASDTSPEETIKFSREPESKDLQEIRKLFDEFKPKRDYRGKYAMMFFMRWLDLLVKDRNSESSVFFEGVKTSESVTTIGLDAVASRSVLPPGLDAFVQNIAAKERHCVV